MNKAALRRAVRVFYPKRCQSCGEIVPIEQEHCLCNTDKVFRIGEDFCPHCGYDSYNCTCRESGEICFDYITAPFIYSGLIKTRLLDFKFGGEKGEAEYFAHNMSLRFAESFPTAKIDCVTFVPMTKSAQRERGFNQSELLAKGVAKRLMLDLQSLLIKTADTASQHTLSREERMCNLNGAFIFSAKHNIFGKTVLLCDDIKTTGTTLSRCCEVLYENGAETVYCLCAAVSDNVVNIRF